MNLSDIEAWVLQVLDRVARRQSLEDSRVELKREWIEPRKAARQIAGHANAARGNSILWLIGVDEKAGPSDINSEELSSWLPRVNAEFDGISPSVTNLIIPTSTFPVVALLFETNRPPYVVKTGLSGAVTHEVPWREGNKIQSAHRHHLVQLLQPYRLQPDLELLNWFASAEAQHCGPREQDYCLQWRFVVACYLTPQSNEQLVIPRHRCRGWFEVTPQIGRTELYDLRLLAPDAPEVQEIISVFQRSPQDALLAQSLTIRATPHESIIDGPGRLEVICTAQTAIVEFREGQQLSFEFSLSPVPNCAPVHRNVLFWCYETTGRRSFWSPVPLTRNEATAQA